MRNGTIFATSRPRDLVSIGRLAVDLYGDQYGARLEDVTSFSKYLGGSSANVAFGCARLGLKSAMLSRVGDDQMGNFLLETLRKEGCDASQTSVDHERLTALVLLGIKDRGRFPLLFYRENCADMALRPEHIDESYIAGSRALHITGTHFSTEGVMAASLQALAYARKHNVRTVLDIDYRPVLWGLTGRGDGETRYVASDNVSHHMQDMLSHFDLIVGTVEEFLIAGGTDDLITSLRKVRERSAGVLVVKLGPAGCAVIDGDIPDSMDEAFTVPGFKVTVLNELGAGDAFLAGFLSGWLRGEDYELCCRKANACGALVVSRHACAQAMPTAVELEYYLANHATMGEPSRDAELAHLHRVTVPRVRWGDVCIFAFDHRSQLDDLVREVGADQAMLPRLKSLLVEVVAQTERELGLQGGIGVLIDDRYGQDALFAATGRGWWVGCAVEAPGSNPLRFQHGTSIGAVLRHWPAEYVIKCLVFYHPDDTPENRLEQEAQVMALYRAAQISGHELLIEVIPPSYLPCGPDTVLRALKRFYNLGVRPEWWKLQPMPAQEWEHVDSLIQERDPYCRGVVMLGLNAPLPQLVESFKQAQGSRTCRGFAVGRTIFHEPARAWLAGEIGDAEVVSECRKNFEQLIKAWQAIRSAGEKNGRHAI